jgi:glycosyltransferase involved in cell wall biosynthesis
VVGQGLKPWNRITLYWDYWAKTECIVRAWEPDLVHTCDLEGLVGGGRAARALGVSQVHDCHELFLERTLFTQLDRRVLSFFERRAMRRADAVTVVNASIGEELQRRYGVTSTVIRNCADKVNGLTVRDIRSIAGLPSEVNVVLYQGGMLDGRGLREVVRSAAFYGKNTRLVFLGYGSLRGTLEALAEELLLDGKVHFIDAVPPDELLAITASATIGVVPYQPVSLNNRLALPNKIFEYLAVGLPVIVSDIPELRRIVSSTGCGLAYDPYDPRALGDAVNRLLHPDALERARIAAKAYGDANTWDTEGGLLRRIYERVLVAPHLATVPHDAATTSVGRDPGHVGDEGPAALASEASKQHRTGQ